jgi:dihydrofolate synthase/folylpolyglutamate synthase
LLTTKAAEDFLVHLAPRAASLTAVGVPGHSAAYAPQDLTKAAKRAGFQDAAPADSLIAAVDRINSIAVGRYRVLICGSLYLAGEVLKEHT